MQWDAKNERLISARTKSKRLETFGTCFCSSEDCVRLSPQLYLGGGFKYFLLSALPGKMIQFDEYFSKALKPPTSYSSNS